MIIAAVVAVDVVAAVDRPLRTLKLAQLLPGPRSKPGAAASGLGDVDDVVVDVVAVWKWKSRCCCC